MGANAGLKLEAAHASDTEEQATYAIYARMKFETGFSISFQGCHRGEGSQQGLFGVKFPIAKLSNRTFWSSCVSTHLPSSCSRTLQMDDGDHMPKPP